MTLSWQSSPVQPAILIHTAYNGKTSITNVSGVRVAKRYGTARDRQTFVAIPIRGLAGTISTFVFKKRYQCFFILKAIKCSGSLGLRIW